MTRASYSTGYMRRMRLHLATYKSETLRVSEDGRWERNKQSYPHILPKEHRWLNILPPLRAGLRQYLAETKPRVKLHQNFHHLTSSQAMGFNLLYPWFDAGEGSAFLSCAGAESADVVKWKFEHIPDPVESTNLDFWVQQRDKREIHFELKLTESGFGSAKYDVRHIDKVETLYAPRLRGKVLDGVTTKELLSNYQLMRLVSGLEIDRGDRFLVIAPSANSTLRSQFARFATMLTPETRERMMMVDLETLLSKLTAHRDVSATIRTAVELFTMKYVLSPGAA